MQMFCQLVQFASASFKTVDASFVFNGFHQPANCRGGFAPGCRPSSGPKPLTAGLFTKLGGVMSEVIDCGSGLCLSNKQLNLILKMG